MTALARLGLLLLLVAPLLAAPDLAASQPAAPQPARADSPAEIHRELAAALEHGLAADQARALVDRGLRLATSAQRPADEWRALAAVAAVCRHSLVDAAAHGRRQSLALLTRRFHDSRRWSLLLTEGFVPPFDELPAAERPAALDGYEQDFARAAQALADGPDRPRLAAELAWGRLAGRLALARRPDGLTPAQLAQMSEDLESIGARYGTLPLPGAAEGDAGATVGDRAREALAEFAAVAIGRPGPATVAQTLDGQALNLADLRGKIVILDFWTSFCSPCLALVPYTRDLLQRLDGEPVVVIGVCGDADRAKGRATAERLGMTWPSLWDGPTGPDGPIAKAWHVTGWPSVFVLDGEGRIRFRFYDREGVEGRLEGAVRGLLTEG